VGGVDAGVQDAAPLVSDAALDVANVRDAANDVQARDASADGGETPDGDGGP
jgi:hypothetical protein